MEQSHDVRNLVVLVALHVVQHEHGFIARRQLIDGALQMDAIDGAAQLQIGPAKIAAGTARIFVGLGELIERRFRSRLFPQLHEHNVDGQTVQPRRKGRLAAKRRDLAKELKERLLRQILRLGGVPPTIRRQRE